MRNIRVDMQKCGDDCKGECSGEVNGIPHCPLSKIKKPFGDYVKQDDVVKYHDRH